MQDEAIYRKHADELVRFATGPAGLLLRGDPGPVSDGPPRPVLPAATAHVEIEIPWFDGAERGTTYELTPDAGRWGFQRRVWFSAEQTSGPTAIGTDRLRLPGRTGEGWHTLCEELSGRCFRIEMVASEQAPDIRALLPPAAPGDVVMLPLLPAAERTTTFSMASAEEPGVPLFELTGPDHVVIPDIAPPGASSDLLLGAGRPLLLDRDRGAFARPAAGPRRVVLRHRSVVSSRTRPPAVSSFPSWTSVIGSTWWTGSWRHPIRAAAP